MHNRTASGAAETSLAELVSLCSAECRRAEWPRRCCAAASARRIVKSFLIINEIYFRLMNIDKYECVCVSAARRSRRDAREIDSLSGRSDAIPSAITDG